MLLVLVLLVNLLGCLAYYFLTREEPSFIQPKIVASGPKYQPRPYYPEKRVPEQLKELSQYERIEYITP